MAFRQFRVKQLFTLLANTVAELSIRVIGDIFFYWDPYAVFISDFIAIGTDRQESAKRPAHVFFMWEKMDTSAKKSTSFMVSGPRSCFTVIGFAVIKPLSRCFYHGHLQASTFFADAWDRGTLLNILTNYFPAFSIFLKQQMWTHPVVALFRLMSCHIPLSISQTINVLSQHSQLRPLVPPDFLAYRAIVENDGWPAAPSCHALVLTKAEVENDGGACIPFSMFKCLYQLIVFFRPSYLFLSTY
jgi:hypothetical protein